MASLLTFLLGMGLVAVSMIVCNLYMVLSRNQRRLRNVRVILFGTILLMASYLGALLILLKGVNALGFPPHSAPRTAAVLGNLTGLLLGTTYILRTEFRWRKSVGLDSKSLRPNTKAD